MQIWHGQRPPQAFALRVPLLPLPYEKSGFRRRQAHISVNQEVAHEIDRKEGLQWRQREPLDYKQLQPVPSGRLARANLFTYEHGTYSQSRDKPSTH